MNTDEIEIRISPRRGKPTRLVIARFADDGEHRAMLNTDSDTSRARFLRKLAAKTGIDCAELLEKLDRKLTQLADAADAAAELEGAMDGDSQDSAMEEKEHKSQATQLVELALTDGVALFHDPDGVAFARYRVDDHHEVARVGSGQFKRWLARRYFDRTGKAPNSQAKADAAGVLEGTALYEGDERRVHVRIAEHDGRIYLDLCNDRWQAVEIDAHGWRVVNEAPVMFRRAKAMLSLPTPQGGGSIDELHRFIDAEPTSFRLIVAWLIAALRPHGPYPVLQFDGEQGSGKSTRARMLRSLVDPNTADLRSEPREARDLVIAANNGHVIALDNLSNLPQWLSDCLCRLATGGGFSARTLYENDEETIFNVQRPVLLNGIEQVAWRGDLIDRCLLVSLPAISEHKRMAEADLWSAFMAARPQLLGVLLTAVSAAIKSLPTTHLSSLPRMADFALWVTAAESALGWETGTFVAAYTGNRDEADHLAIESSTIGKFLMELLEHAGGWEGTATELLRELESRAGLVEAKWKPKGWPANAKSISGQIRRIAPHLRKLGWETCPDRETSRERRRMIVIRRGEQSSVQCVQSVQDATEVIDQAGRNRTESDDTVTSRTQAETAEANDRTQTDAADAGLDPNSDAQSQNCEVSEPLEPAEELTDGELREWLKILQEKGVEMRLARRKAVAKWPPGMQKPWRREQWARFQERIAVILAEDAGMTTAPKPANRKKRNGRASSARNPTRRKPRAKAA